jgi:hypothetical protein
MSMRRGGEGQGGHGALSFIARVSANAERPLKVLKKRGF